MELTVSLARTRGNNAAFADFLSEGTRRRGHPSIQRQEEEAIISTPMSPFTFQLHLPAYEVPAAIAGRLHDVVLGGTFFFFS